MKAKKKNVSKMSICIHMKVLDQMYMHTKYENFNLYRSKEVRFKFANTYKDKQKDKQADTQPVTKM